MRAAASIQHNVASLTWSHLICKQIEYNSAGTLIGEFQFELLPRIRVSSQMSQAHLIGGRQFASSVASNFPL